MTSSPGNDRTRQSPIERFSAPQHAFDLCAEVESLKAEHLPATKRHRQKTLYKRGRATIALFVFNKDAGLANHQAAGVVTIHAINGRLRIKARNTDESVESTHILTSGNILILAPNVLHEVYALEESAMLLQVHLE